MYLKGLKRVSKNILKPSTFEIERYKVKENRPLLKFEINIQLGDISVDEKGIKNKYSDF